MQEDQAYRLNVIRDLSSKVKEDRWVDLLQGGDDEEIVAGFSDFDRRHAIEKARHVCDALKYMFGQIANKKLCTWAEACDEAASMNYHTKTGRTVQNWYCELHATQQFRFRPSQRGRTSSQAKSPFEEDESLLMQFKSWARSDLEHLNIKKAKAWINNVLLKDWTTEQFATYKIKFPVTDYVTSRWMEEAGFKYERHQKCYYVDKHEDPDVIQSRIEYIQRFFDEEVYEACWVQLELHKYNRMVIEQEKALDESDFTEEVKDAKKEVFEFLKSKAHFYQDEVGNYMVEVHVDTFESDLPVHGTHGGNLSVRKPAGARQRIRLGQDEVIYRSSQLNDYCWSIEGEQTLRSKGLGEGKMVSGIATREFGFGRAMSDEELARVNAYRANQWYKDRDAATYLLGSASKSASPLKTSPFVRMLEYGKGKDGYWTYNHMVLQLEDVVDCMTVLYPDPVDPSRCMYDLVFELDHSSGHNADRKDGLSTCPTQLRLGWGGKQRYMRDTKLSAEDLGTVAHGRALRVGDTQSLVFQEGDLPPVQSPNAPGSTTGTGSFETIKYNADELRKILEENGLSADGRKPELVGRAVQAGIAIERRVEKTVDGYFGRQKGGLQMAFERGFFDESLKVNGKKVSWLGDIVTKADKERGIEEVRDRSTSVLHMLKGCHDFRTEKTQLMAIVENELKCFIRLTPKCHPEIAGVGIEYAWGYSKMRFRNDFNDGQRKNLAANVERALSPDTLTKERIRKFARKAREYKLTYAYLIEKNNGSTDRVKRDSIEKITKIFKQHRSALDADYGFIARA